MKYVKHFGTWGYILHRLSGLALTGYILIHIYLVFVALGLYHGLSGVWAVIRDYNMPVLMSKMILALILIVGLFLGILGFIWS